MSSPSLHPHYRSFNTTTAGSAPHFSPNHGCRFPLSIWPDEMEFTCSLKWPVLRSCQLNPGCDVASISDHPPHSVIGTTVTTYFSHRNLLYRGFVTGSFSFSSISTHLQGSKSPFFLTAHYILISLICSVRWFDSCFGKPPSEGLSIGYPIVLHPFQSTRPAFKVDSSHTRFRAWRRWRFTPQMLMRRTNV